MASSAISLVGDINPNKDSWKIRVRVIRLWRQTGFSNPSKTNSLDMILMDEMGEKIHASVRKNLVSKFESLIQEGNAHLLGNFRVAGNSIRYPMAKHEYKINFCRQTTVKMCTMFSGSIYGFEFAYFDDICAKRLELDSTYPVEEEKLMGKQQLPDSVSELDPSTHIILIIQLRKFGEWQG